MITKVPLKHPCDGRLRKTDEGALMRIEAKAGLYEACVRNLDEILFVLATMQELSGEPLGQPQVRGDYLVKDLLPADGACRLGLDEQLTRTFGQFFTGRMLMGDNRKRRVRHERATLSL
jgi:hypothetical protein